MTVEQHGGSPDLVGQTSARLVALGVDRRERLEALHLLAILDASADCDDRIRRPIDDLAAEFELPIEGVFRSMNQLEQAGAVARSAGSVQLLGRDAGGVGGLHLADFLDDVRVAFDEREERTTRWHVRAGAALVAAAAAVAVLTLAPSPTGTPAPVAIGRSTTTADRAADQPARVAPTTTTGAPADEPTVTAPDTTIAAPDTPIAAAACPEGSPVVRIAEGLVLISNPTVQDLIVTVFAINGTPIAVDRLLVPAGETVSQEQLFPVDDISVDEWEWVDPAIEGSCGS